MKNDKKKFIGIREIAKIAGVSTATVSRVINQPDSTSDDVKKKVQDVIKKYNYVPNQMAKNLFTRQSNSIAIFIYDVSNPFFTKVIHELNNIAFENKYALLICDTENNVEKEKEFLRYCQSIRCDKIVLTEGVNYNLFIGSDISQTVACLDRCINDTIPCVTSDNYTGIRQLVDYLYNLGHRKIAFAGAMEEYHSATIRKLSYLDALKSHDIKVREDLIYESGRFCHRTGIMALDHFWSLNDRPTAIVCANDQIAQGLIMRAYKHNLSVPGDLSVTGFDGIDEDYFYPRITTVKQNVRKLSEELFNSVINKNGPKIIQIKTSLIIGESCQKI